MNAQIINKLRAQSDFLVQRTDLKHLRFLLHQVAWDWRCIGIKGPRGVGKTTMLLQRIKLSASAAQSVYLSLDDLFFQSITLREVVETFRLQNFTHFYLDEVHKYKNWSGEIKNLYDFFPDIHIVFTGSSIIELHKQEADLSRRAVMYDLPGLSFREYLKLTDTVDLPVISLQDLLENHRFLANSIVQDFRPLSYFKNYLKNGYYPFFLEAPEITEIRIRQVVQLVLNLDLVNAEDGRILHSGKIGRLLQTIADSSPVKPNLSNLSRAIEIDRNTVLRYLSHLHKAQLVNLLFPEGGGLSNLQRPEKIYLNNSNLCYALSAGTPEEGQIRETFFQNQLGVKHAVTYPVKADFKVDQKFLFEVGGKGKTIKQIAGEPNAFLALDDMETGGGQDIPLWLFGMLY